MVTEYAPGAGLSGTVRNSWQHSIAAMDVLRYSVTLRTFRSGHGSKDQLLAVSVLCRSIDR
jgi:hypothetical protein